MNSITAPTPPTPFDPGNWGEITDIKTIQRTRVPSQGPDTWRPLPHGTFVEMIEQAFDRHGFTISEPVHYRAKARGNEKIRDLPEYGRFLSLYGIAHPGLPSIEGLTWEGGFGNSYDMTMAAGGGLGDRVSVCSNGMYMGATQGFKRKHTVGMDRDRAGLFEHVFELVDNAIGGLLRQAEGRERQIERFKNTGCEDVDARYVIMEAAKRGVIGAAATMRVLKHWETPEHPEFKDRNVWSLQNAFTSNDRGRNMMTQSDRFGRLDGIINDRFGFLPEVVETGDHSPDVVEVVTDASDW